MSSATLAAVAVVPGSSFADPSPSIDEVRKQVDRLYEQAEKTAERANALGDRMKTIDRRVDKLAADVDSQEKRLGTLRRSIGQFAAAEYRAGGLDTTVQLLVAKDPDEFLAKLSSAQAFRGQQSDLLTRLQAEQKRLTEQQAARDAELARYREARRQAVSSKKEVEAKAAKAQALLDRLTEEQRQRLEALQEQREGAAGRSSRGGDRIPPLPPGSGRGITALEYARAQLGDPYSYGAAGPDSFDCSGLTLAAWAEAGVSLPHSAREQYNVSPKVDQSQLAPGDLVMFYSDMHHVGIYAGDGMVIHAPKPGESVEYIQMDYMPYAGAVRPG